MAFWGVVVKPDEPYAHKVDKERSRLRVSLATLGEEVSGLESRIVLKCKVGDGTPISLCNLLPGKSETVRLNIEFEEETDILFTVLGPCSVHISGNYLKNNAGNGSSSSDGNSDDTSSDDITSTRTSMRTGIRHVTLNVKDAPKEELRSDDSRSLSTDSPVTLKKPQKSRKRKRAKRR